jgi:hypothetical protein
VIPIVSFPKRFLQSSNLLLKGRINQVSSSLVHLYSTFALVMLLWEQDIAPVEKFSFRSVLIKQLQKLKSFLSLQDIPSINLGAKEAKVCKSITRWCIDDKIFGRMKSHRQDF